MSVKLQLCLLAQKMYPQWCWLLFESAGLKECARDVGVVMAVFAGSKKYTRNNVGCTLCLRIYKNVPATVLVAPRVCGFKKMHRDSVGYSLRLWVHKNVPAMSVKLRLCLRVQKNVPADRVEWLCVKCCHDMLLAV